MAHEDKNVRTAWSKGVAKSHSPTHPHSERLAVTFSCIDIQVDLSVKYFQILLLHLEGLGFCVENVEILRINYANPAGLCKLTLHAVIALMVSSSTKHITLFN